MEPPADPAPRLRDGVTIELTSSARGTINDPASGLAVEVDGGVARLCAAIDGRRAVGDLRAALALEGVAVDDGDVRRVVELLDSLFLLDNERGRARAQAEVGARSQAPAVAPHALNVLPPLRVLSDARWDCHGCGFCCSNGQKFGPIPAEERDRILAHDWRGHLDRVEGRPEELFYEVDPEDGGPPQIYLSRSEGRCVFLAKDNLCTIHARVGADVKPHICRLFPMHPVSTPEGLAVALRPECRSMHRSRTTGTPLTARIPELLHLAGTSPAIQRVGALVQLTSGVAIPYATANALRLAALRVVERPGVSIEASLLCLRDLVLSFSRAIGDRPGEAEIQAARALADGHATDPGAPLTLAPISPEQEMQAQRALTAIVLEQYDAGSRNFFYMRAEGGFGSTRLGLQEAGAIAALSLLARLSPLLPKPLERMPPVGIGRVLAVRMDLRADGPVGGVLRDAARNEIFAWMLTSTQPLLPGYVVMTFAQMLAEWLARRIAADRGATEVSPEDAHEGILLATIVVSSPINNRSITRDMRRAIAWYAGETFRVV